MVNVLLNFLAASIEVSSKKVEGPIHSTKDVGDVGFQGMVRGKFYS